MMRRLLPKPGMSGLGGLSLDVLRGDAGVTVEFGAGAITADVAFTNIADVETGDPQDDMTWRGMTVEDGGNEGDRHEAI